MELDCVGFVNRIPQDPTARNNRIHVFRPGDFRKATTSRSPQHAAGYWMKHEPCDGFGEMLLNVIFQCVCELCQTEDNLKESRKNRTDTREPQKLTIKSYTPPLA